MPARAALFTLSLLAAGIAVPARAQTPVPMIPIDDQVTLTLSAEDWIVSETAEVIMSVEVAGAGAAATAIRAELMKVAAQVADKAEWRIVSLEPQRDSAGLDRWRATLSTRMPEKSLAGLAEKAKQASRPGLQTQIDAISFDPTLAETQAVAQRLRSDLYARAGDELNRLNATVKGRVFRIARIDFDEPGDPGRPKMAVRAMAQSAAADSVAVGVQVRVRLTARVTFGSLVDPPDGKSTLSPLK